MSYETAVASMFALGHELAQTPSHKFDLAHMRVLLQAMDRPERRFSSVLKSRKPRFTGFFTLKTNGDAMKTHEMWV